VTKAQIRELLETYIYRRGRGAVKEIVEALGISRQHLNAFRNGGSIGGNYLVKIVEFLRERGFDVMPAPPTYRSDTPKEEDPMQIVAAELRNLADFLDAPAFDDETKVERFTLVIRGYHGSLEGFRSAMKKRK